MRLNPAALAALRSARTFEAMLVCTQKVPTLVTSLQVTTPDGGGGGELGLGAVVVGVLGLSGVEGRGLEGLWEPEARACR
ncbi:MAG: hypothetical protein R2716_11030 [Microthrixaceae bacterium]